MEGLLLMRKESQFLSVPSSSSNTAKEYIYQVEEDETQDRRGRRRRERWKRRRRKRKRQTDGLKNNIWGQRASTRTAYTITVATGIPVYVYLPQLLELHPN